MDIEINCTVCGKINGFSLEESLNDRTITCSYCSHKMYWHNCLECETGYADNHKDFNCPRCNQVEKNISYKTKLSLPIFEKECPWCGEPINVLSYILLKKIIGECPKCKKYYNDSGTIKSLLIFIIFMVSSVGVLKPILLKYPSDLLKVVAVAVLFILGIAIFIKSICLVKYKL